MLGKSVEDFKLWMPSAMKADLASLAGAGGAGPVRLGIRKIMALRLLGDAFHRKWQAAIGRVPRQYRETGRGSRAREAARHLATAQTAGARRSTPSAPGLQACRSSRSSHTAPTMPPVTLSIMSPITCDGLPAPTLRPTTTPR
jgi:hypothetical protein